MPIHRPAAAGRLRGAAVGIAFGMGWAAYGLSLVPLWGRVVGGAVAVLVLIVLMREALGLLRRARELPPPDEAQAPAGRRQRLGFIAILIVEIILLNIAVGLLRTPALQAYWIPAIGAVVGLHFLPLAWLFRYRAFWACGAAMTVAAAGAAVAIHQNPGLEHAAVAVQSLVNAVVLWLTAASGLAGLRGRLPQA